MILWKTFDYYITEFFHIKKALKSNLHLNSIKSIYKIMYI